MAKQSNKVRVAIIGVGNCANALIQGVHYYKNAPDDAEIPGLMHATVGGYHIRDIEFVTQYLQLVHGGAHPEIRSGNTLDGLLLSGGVDVAPHRYGETPHPKLGDVDAGRDEV